MVFSSAWMRDFAVAGWNGFFLLDWFSSAVNIEVLVLVLCGEVTWRGMLCFFH